MKHKRIRNDILLALAVLLAAGAFYWVFHTSSSRGQWAVIEQNGTEIARLSLFERTSYPVITDLGRNVIQTGHGCVWMEMADCPDGLCIGAGKISTCAERIVCLPHRLVVRVEGSTESLDDIVN